MKVTYCNTFACVLVMVLLGSSAIAQVTSNGMTAAPASAFDFSNASVTAPARVVAADPATCIAKEFVFNSTANLFKLCGPDNSWTPLYTIAAGTYTTIAASGRTLTIDADTAKLTTQSASQQGTAHVCTDAGASGTAYSCVMTPVPATYTDKMPVIFTPNTSCSGGSTTLALNGMTAKLIVKLDGATNPAANDCRANVPTPLIYNAALNGGNGAFVMTGLLGNAAGGLGDPGSNGFPSRTALNTTIARMIAGTPNHLTVTNGDGVSGNPTLDLPASMTYTSISFWIDGGGSVISTGVKGYRQLEFACSIVGWSLYADQAGSISIDVDAHASSAPPAAPSIPNTTTDKISAGAPIALSSAQSASGGISEVSTWTASRTLWDTIALNVTSAVTVTKVWGRLTCAR